MHCTNNRTTPTRLADQTDGGSGRQTNGRDTIHMHFPGEAGGGRLERARTLGRYLKDVPYRRREGGSGNVDAVREVAWIHRRLNFLNADKGRRGV